MSVVPHQLASEIPGSNAFQLPRMSNGGTQAKVLEGIYGSGAIVGAFCAKNSDVPSWSRKIAQYDKAAFHKDNPSPITRFSELVRSANDGAGKTMANFMHAIKLWIKGGRKGPMPYTEYQDYGSCVNASFAALITALLGVRASNPLYKELFAFAAAWYVYANRGYCSDGWNMWGLAKVAYEIGIAFRQAYNIGSFSVDFTDDNKNEQIVARGWCRGGVPDEMATYTQANHPFAPGSIVEFDGDIKGLREVFARGGGINCGGTNTSGGSRPFTIGRVGPHEQCGYGADDSDDFRKFCNDVIGVKPRDNDFPIHMDQTWGDGFSGECADKYWPVGTLEDGRVLTQADMHAMRALNGEDAVWDFIGSMGNAESWGWGAKPQGCWVWWASDILRYFAGDIFAVFPDFKGVPDLNPDPVPTPDPDPVPSPLPEVVEVDIRGHLKPGKYILFPKAIV